MIIAYYTKNQSKYNTPFEIEILELGMKSTRFREIFIHSINSPVGEKTHKVWGDDGLIWRYIGDSNKDYDYEFIMDTDVAKVLPNKIKSFLRDYKINKILKH